MREMKRTVLCGLALLMLLCGCGSSGQRLRAGDHGTAPLRLLRGISAGEGLFVRLDKEITVDCEVEWEVLRDGVTVRQVELAVTGVQMSLQDDLDGLTGEQAWAETMEGFVYASAEEIGQKLTTEALSVTVNVVSIVRNDAP